MFKLTSETKPKPRFNQGHAPKDRRWISYCRSVYSENIHTPIFAFGLSIFIGDFIKIHDYGEDIGHFISLGVYHMDIE